MEHDLSEMNSWNSLPGPLTLSVNATSMSMSIVKAGLNEGQPIKIDNLLRNIATKNHSDAEPKVCSHGKDATTDVLYQSRETVFESHKPPARKRARDEEHNKKIMEQPTELTSFTGCMSALLSL